MAITKKINFYPKTFKPIDLTAIDKQIMKVKVNVPDDNQYDSYSFDFNNINRSFSVPRFQVNNFNVNKIKINFDEPKDEYEVFDISSSLDVMRPFQYTGIKINNNQKYERVNQLTPSEEWPRITFLTDDEFKL